MRSLSYTCIMECCFTFKNESPSYKKKWMSLKHVPKKRSQCARALYSMITKMEHSWKGNTNQEDVRDHQGSEEEETNKQEEYRECLKLWNFLWFWNMGFIHYTLPQPLSQCTTPRLNLAISWEPRARVFIFNLFCSTMLEPWPSDMINKFSITALYSQPSFVFFFFERLSQVT